MARKGVAGDDEQILDQASLSCITSLAAHVLHPGLVMPCATAENHTVLIWKRVEKYRQDWPGSNLAKCHLHRDKGERGE